MSTERFRRFEADGSGQQMMPLLIPDQILVKPVSNPDGLALLLRSTTNAQTGEPVSSQYPRITPANVARRVATSLPATDRANQSSGARTAATKPTPT